jgi:hypothetical protein
MAFGHDEEMPDFKFKSQSAHPQSSMKRQAEQPSTATSPQMYRSPDPTGLDDLLELEAQVDRESCVRSLQDMDAQMKNKLRLDSIDHGGRLGGGSERPPMTTTAARPRGRSPTEKQADRGAGLGAKMWLRDARMNGVRSREPGADAECAAKEADQLDPDAMDLS